MLIDPAHGAVLTGPRPGVTGFSGWKATVYRLS
jgi:hypothetical protein